MSNKNKNNKPQLTEEQIENRFQKDSMFGCHVDELVINYEGIKEANKKYAKHTLEALDKESAAAAAKIVSGENIIFSKSKVTERSMIVGFISAISEISQYLMQPETALMQADSMIENHTIKNDILIIGALRDSFLMNRKNGFNNTAEIINWITLNLLETSSEILKKMEEKWPHPKDEDILKEDFDAKNWPQPNAKEIIFFVYESEEYKKLYEKLTGALHGYVNSMYDELGKNLETATWKLDIFKGFYKEKTGDIIDQDELLNRIELVRNIEHQYIDWLFNVKIKDAMIDVMKSSLNLFDLIKLGGISIKQFMSFESKEEKDKELPEAAEETESK